MNKDNVIVVKAIEIEEGIEDDMELYYDMLDFITGNDMSETSNYELAKELIDIQSLIEYYAVEIYIGRCNDWPGSNECLWRCRQIENSEYGDGKWRWVLYDVNGGSLELQYLENDTLRYAMDSSPIFSSLCESDEFREQFAATIVDMAKTNFSNENYDILIASYLQQMTTPLIANEKRFYGNNKTMDDLGYDVAEIKEFLDERYPYIVQSLYDNFGISVE